MAAAVGLSRRRQLQHCQLWRWLMAAAMMASLPTPPTTMTAILALIALALPQTRIERQGGGRAAMHLIRRCHGCRHWCHLSLHSRDDGAKEDGRRTDEAVMPISTVGKRLDTSTPLAWR
jgi:hypothetical protein